MHFFIEIKNIDKILKTKHKKVNFSEKKNLTKILRIQIKYVTL